MRQTDDYTPGSGDEYAEIAEFYDLEHDFYLDDIPMYQQIVDMVGDPVVEFACGSGRVLAKLAEPGRRLTGIDSSGIMLERCRSRFASLSDGPELIHGDMASAQLASGTYGVVLIALNSLMHAGSAEHQLETLQNAFDALDPRGLLVIDVLNPLAQIYDTGDSRVRKEGTSATVTGESISKFSSQEIDLAEQQIKTSIWYDIVDAAGAIRRITTSMELRFVFRSELELMLSAAGFASTQFYGTYDLDPYITASPRLIAMAEKTA